MGVPRQVGISAADPHITIARDAEMIRRHRRVIRMRLMNRRGVALGRGLSISRRLARPFGR